MSPTADPCTASRASCCASSQPLQNGTARATKPFRDALELDRATSSSAKSENGRLQKEVEQLRAGVAQELATQDENAQLRAMVDLQKDQLFPNDVQTVTARVIARSTTAWYSTVTIDAGSNDGVAVYDAVVNGDGLVGRVTKVSPTAAQVTLITDQQSYVDAMVLPGDLRAAPRASSPAASPATSRCSTSTRTRRSRWASTS